MGTVHEFLQQAAAALAVFETAVRDLLAWPAARRFRSEGPQGTEIIINGPRHFDPCCTSYHTLQSHADVIKGARAAVLCVGVFSTHTIRRINELPASPGLSRSDPFKRRHNRPSRKGNPSWNTKGPFCSARL
jgi:hypothetical protein